MQVTINIDNELLSKLCEEELGNVPKEEIHKIILQGLKDYLTYEKENSKNFNESTGVFICQNSYGYNTKREASDFLKSIVNKVDLSEHVKEYYDTMINELKTNYESHLKQAMVDYFMSCMNASNYEFQNKITMAVRDRISR